MKHLVDDATIAFAEKLADAAGEIARRYFRTPLAVDTKPDNSPVTLADREIETTLRAMIAQAYPTHAVLGEEEGHTKGSSPFTWVIDPIDGTTSFITGKPLFTTLVALAENGMPRIGIIDQPVSGDRWVGVAGRKTLWNGKAIQSRACPLLKQAVLATTSPYLFNDTGKERLEALRTQCLRTHFGGDAYNYGLLAAGYVDVVLEYGLKPYDFTALVPVIEGAGGKITDWSGKPLTLASKGDVLAAGDPALHAAISASWR